jgi:hypothetical protein
MAKATGKGEIRDNLSKPRSQRFSVTGLLFNFDIDGDVVKDEHLAWLERNVVPLLGVKDAIFSLKGSASRSGNNAHNMELSGRRVNNVKRFLLSRGGRAEQLSTAFVGEEEAALAGKKDGGEDKEDRAVAVAVVVPRGPGILRFDRIDPNEIEDGFEAGRDPQWLMVPMLGRRQLLLLNGKGMRLSSSRPFVLRFIDPVTGRSTHELFTTSDRQVVTFEGGMPGEADVFAEDLVRGGAVKLLETHVLVAKTVKLAFHLITDPQNPTPKRKPETISAMLKQAQRVYRAQANLLLEAINSTPAVLKFTQNLSDTTAPLRNGISPVTPKTVGGDKFPVLQAKGDTNARVNIFYLWEWESGEPDTNAQADDFGGKGVVYEDDTGSKLAEKEGYTLGHEFGHCFNLKHTGTTDLAKRVRLMWNTTNEHKGVLTREEILEVHSKA